MENQIGTTIYEQIASVKVLTVGGFGSANFFAVAGAKDLVTTDDGLQFGVRVRGKNFNKIVVKLNGSDLYDVEFWNIKAAKGIIDQVETLTDIGAENLVAVLMDKVIA